MIKSISPIKVPEPQKNYKKNVCSSFRSGSPSEIIFSYIGNKYN